MIGVCSKVTCEYFRGYSYCTAPSGCIYTTDPSHIKTAVEIVSEQKTQTNADKVRAMTDEELAEWKVKDCPPGKEPTDACFYAEAGGDSTVCRLCWHDWLKQEVDDET